MNQPDVEQPAEEEEGADEVRPSTGRGTSRARNRNRQIDTGPPIATIVGVSLTLLALAGFLVWMFFAGGVTPEQRVMRELNEPVAPLPKGDPPPLAAAGRDVYERQCASCHGSRLGGGSAPNLRARRYTPPRWEDQDLANVIYGGRGSMPAFRDSISPGELAGVVAYLRWEQGVEFSAGASSTNPSEQPEVGTRRSSPTSSP